MAKTTKLVTEHHDGLEKQAASTRPLTRINFLLMIASGVMIVLGFLLMLGGGNDAGVFNPEIFSTRRVVVGPTVAFLGFIAMGIAILYRPRHSKE